MYILEISETCNSAALSVILPVIKNIMVIIQLIVPIILIVMSVIEVGKLTITPDDKTGLKKILNKVLAAFIIFLLPILINVVMGLVGESTEFSNCWNKTDTGISINNGNYIE